MILFSHLVSQTAVELEKLPSFDARLERIVELLDHTGHPLDLVSSEKSSSRSF